VVGHTVIYGMSDNRSTWWDNGRARHVGYRPQDSSEPFRAALEATPAAHRPDPARGPVPGRWIRHQGPVLTVARHPGDTPMFKPLLLSALLGACPGQRIRPPGPAEFRSADTHNADDYPTVVAVRHMSELLEKKSGGKHKIKVFNKQALGSEKETIDQVKIGALDFTRVNVGPMNGICPLTQVPTMPFLFGSIAHMRKVLDGPVGDEILKSCEAVGFVGLAFYDSGARSIYAKKPIRTVADAKGLKIRVQQSDLWVALVSAMGANADARCPTARSTPA
jgi:hypothetical protein